MIFYICFAMFKFMCSLSIYYLFLEPRGSRFDVFSSAHTYISLFLLYAHFRPVHFDTECDSYIY